jgi:hypothetical protein
MPIPVVLTGAAIGLAVAFYMESKNGKKPVPAEGAEGAAGGQHASSATGDTMAIDETGSAVAVRETDAGPMVENPETNIDAPGSGWTGARDAIAAGVGGVMTTPVVASPARESPVVAAATERIGGIAAGWRKPATTVQKPMPMHGGKGTGARPIPITSMPTRGMSRLQASKVLGVWAGQNRLVR